MIVTKSQKPKKERGQESAPRPPRKARCQTLPRGDGVGTESLVQLRESRGSHQFPPQANLYGGG